MLLQQSPQFLKQQEILPASVLYCIRTEHPRLSGRWGGDLCPGQQTCHGFTIHKGFHPIYQCLLCLQRAKLWFLDWWTEFAPVALSHNQAQSACLSIFLHHNSLMRSELLSFPFTRWEKLRSCLPLRNGQNSWVSIPKAHAFTRCWPAQSFLPVFKPPNPSKRSLAAMCQETKDNRTKRFQFIQGNVVLSDRKSNWISETRQKWGQLPRLGQKWLNPVCLS